MQKYSCGQNKGFTLVEMLLVIVIAGAILAVVVPRAYRANTESKYVLLRQTCTELASNANMWAERMLNNQPVTDNAKLIDYMDTLARRGGGAAQFRAWIGRNGASNWHSRGAFVSPSIGSVTGTVSAKIEDLMSPSKKPRNPFNGASVFLNVNYPTAGNPVPGAIACAWRTDTTVSNTNHYYALIFQGTDNTDGGWNFHAGQDDGNIAGLRNGVFIALLEP